MAESFLGRWAQRKADARQGKPLLEPVLPTPTVAVEAPIAQELTSVPTAAPIEPEAPPLTLEDTQSLTPDSDFRPFAARTVAPAVRNAAMKKLFSDPHFNVMDRLDTYIDDYSIADPLPAGMLRQLASSQFLKLVDDEVMPSAAPIAAPADALAPADPANTITTTTSTDHDDTDLRLQPNHAAQPHPTGSSAE